MKLYRYNESGMDYYCNHIEVEVVDMRSTGTSVNDPWYISASNHSDGLLIITAERLLPVRVRGVAVMDSLGFGQKVGTVEPERNKGEVF